jgi:hypothetical protein
MSLKTTKDWASFIGVDLSSKPDQSVMSAPCMNCGVYRMIDNHFVMEKCPGCGDDETDLTLPTIYESDDYE